MTYSKKQLEQFSEETGFLKHYIEKVVRLLDVLNYLFNNIHKNTLLKIFE